MKIKKFTYASLLAMVLIVCMFGFTACGKKLEYITLDTSNVKTVVEYNEDLDLTKLTVKAVYNDGKYTEILKSDEYQIDLGGFDKTVPNNYVVTITYKEKSATFNVTVNARPAPVAVGIAIDTTNVKKSYEWGEAFNASNLIVTKQMDYGDSQTATNEEIEIDSSAFNANVADTYDIIVKLKGTDFTQTFSVTVNHAPVESVELETANTKKVFELNDDFDCQNVILTKISAEGRFVATSEEVEVDSSEFNASVAGTYDIVVKLKGTNLEKTYSVTVNPLTVTGLSIDKQALKTQFYLGQTVEFNADAISLYYQYAGENNADVLCTEDFEIDVSGVNNMLAGDYDVIFTVVGTEYRCTVVVTILSETAPYAMEISGMKTEFEWGDSFTLGEEFVAKLLNYDGTETILSENQLVVLDDEFTSNRPGEYTIYIRYGRFQKDYNISIANITEEKKASYFAFDNITITTQTGNTFVLPYEKGKENYCLRTNENTKFNVQINCSSNYAYVSYSSEKQLENITVIDSVHPFYLFFSITDGAIYNDFYFEITAISPVENITVGGYTKDYSSSSINEINLEIFKKDYNDATALDMAVNFREEGYVLMYNGQQVENNSYNIELTESKTYTFTVVSNLYSEPYTFLSINIEVFGEVTCYLESVNIHYVDYDDIDRNNSFITRNYGMDWFLNVWDYPRNLEITANFNSEFEGYKFKVVRLGGDEAIFIGENCYNFIIKDAEDNIVTTLNASLYVWDNYNLENSISNVFTSCEQSSSTGIFYITTNKGTYEENSVENLAFYNANGGLVEDFAIGENELVMHYTVKGTVFKANCILTYKPYPMYSFTVNGKTYTIGNEISDFIIECEENETITINLNILDGYIAKLRNGDVYSSTNNVMQFNFGEIEYLAFELYDENSQARYVQVVNLSFCKKSKVQSISVDSYDDKVFASRAYEEKYRLCSSVDISNFSIKVADGYTYQLYVEDKPFANNMLHIGTNLINIRIFNGQNVEVENVGLEWIIDTPYIFAFDFETESEVQIEANNYTGEIELSNFRTDNVRVEISNYDFVAKINGEVVDLDGYTVSNDITVVDVQFGNSELPVFAKMYIIKTGALKITDVFDWVSVEYLDYSTPLIYQYVNSVVELPLSVALEDCEVTGALNQNYQSDCIYSVSIVNGGFVINVTNADGSKNYSFNVVVKRTGVFNSITDLGVEIMEISGNSDKTYREENISITVKAGAMIRFYPENENAIYTSDNLPLNAINDGYGIGLVLNNVGNINFTLKIVATDGITEKTFNISIIVEEAEDIIQVISGEEIKKFNLTNINNDSIGLCDVGLVAFLNEENAQFDSENQKVQLVFNCIEGASIYYNENLVGPNGDYFDYQVETYNGTQVKVVRFTVVRLMGDIELIVMFDKPQTICDITIGEDTKTLQAYKNGYVGADFMKIESAVMGIFGQSGIQMEEIDGEEVYSITISLSNIADGFTVYGMDGNIVEDVSNVEISLDFESLSVAESYMGTIMIADKEGNAYVIVLYLSDLMKEIGYLSYIYE